MAILKSELVQRVARESPTPPIKYRNAISVESEKKRKFYFEEKLKKPKVISNKS
jgi:hypothetical protein